MSSTNTVILHKINSISCNREFILTKWLCLLAIFLHTFRVIGVESSSDFRQDDCHCCYRKLMTGRRLSDDHVMRNVACERIEECHRLCEHENSFVCDGFNYGRVLDRSKSYICELTSASGSNSPRDFVEDSGYDYWARDWSCSSRPEVVGGSRRADPPAGEARLKTPNSPRPWHPANNYEKNRLPASSRDPFFYEKSPAWIDSRDRIINNYDDRAKHPSWRDRSVYDKDRLPIGRGSYLTRRRRPESINPPSYSPSYVDYYPEKPARNFEDSRRLDKPFVGTNELLPVSYGQLYPHRDYQISPDHGEEKNRWTNYSGLKPRLYPPQNNPPPWPHYYYNRPGKKNVAPGSDFCCPGNEQSGWTDLSRSRLPPPPPPPPPVRNNYPAYDRNNRPEAASNWKPTSIPKWLPRTLKMCSVRTLVGFKVARKIILAEYTVQNVHECEILCSNKATCRLFAYRYSLVPSAPTDNCLLSDVPFGDLNFYTDLEPERDYDIYAIQGDSKSCNESKNSSLSQPGMQRRSSEECFWRVLSDCEIPPGLVRKEIRVENGLGECQMACISSHHFTCRSFVFSYDAQSKANCFLSDCPTREIIIALESGGISNGNYHSELYERGSYGRGCEAFPFAPIYNSVNFRNKHQPGVQEDCYSSYNSGCKLSPYAIASMSRVDSENECRRQCSRMRHTPHSPVCMSFSFRVGDAKHGDNCYLSDVPRRDLRPGVDYTLDDDYVTYAWKELEPQCSFPYGKPEYNPRWNLGAASRPENNRPTFVPIPADNSENVPVADIYAYNTLHLGAKPPHDSHDNPDFQPQDPSNFHPEDNGLYFDFNPHTDSLASFNRHYTVNGYPCKRGTKCEMNKIVGFWSCEPEGGEYGSWDYCCEPSNHCGYSQGYRYSWCYVGPSEDQWRPCSDKYYPYLPSPRPGISRDNQPNGINPPYYGDSSFHRHSEVDRKDYYYFHNRDSSDKNAGRHWPIIFLHPVPPPNTTDSVAPPNDSDQLPTSANQTYFNNTTRFEPDYNSNSNMSSSSSSSIVQEHKNHLKRRGLLITNVTIENNGRIKNNNRVQISILPVSKADNSAFTANGTERIAHSDVSFSNVGNFTKQPRHDRVNIGKIERVTRANEVRVH